MQPIVTDFVVYPAASTVVEHWGGTSWPNRNYVTDTQLLPINPDVYRHSV